MTETRKPTSVYGVGTEPDPRFSLANERTALAWMRSALALVGGGVAIISLAGFAEVPEWAPLIGAGSCLGGAALAVRAVRGWARAERALRLREPLPSPRSLPFLAIGVSLFAAATLALALVEILG
ncbi:MULTISPECIES: YidH family protein [unclassified Janibacter]|uniref:YidH family protein n=1 Tax=unclassified Janibacter TaxID=2649294 RepID=UPI003D06D0DC